jgi:hypothetical protein
MQQVMFGVILIVVMAAVPGGLVELATRARDLLAHREARSSVPEGLTKREARP